jgi:hypothetical protein
LLHLHVAGSSHSCLFQLFLFLALEGLFDFVYGRCDLAWWASVTASTAGDD